MIIDILKKLVLSGKQPGIQFTIRQYHFFWEALLHSFAVIDNMSNIILTPMSSALSDICVQQYMASYLGYPVNLALNNGVFHTG